MSQPSYSRGRFQGRDGGRSSQRNPGRYESAQAAQAARVPVKSSEDDENLVFDMQLNCKVCRCSEEACRLCLDQIPGHWKVFFARVRDQAYISERLALVRQEKQVDMTMIETSVKKK